VPVQSGLAKFECAIEVISMECASKVCLSSLGACTSHDVGHAFGWMPCEQCEHMLWWKKNRQVFEKKTSPKSC